MRASHFMWMRAREPASPPGALLAWRPLLSLSFCSQSKWELPVERCSLASEVPAVSRRTWFSFVPINGFCNFLYLSIILLTNMFYHVKFPLSLVILLTSLLRTFCVCFFHLRDRRQRLKSKDMFLIISIWGTAVSRRRRKFLEVSSSTPFGRLRCGHRFEGSSASFVE